MTSPRKRKEGAVEKSIFSNAKDILLKCRESPPAPGIVCEACINQALEYVEQAAYERGLKENPAESYGLGEEDGFAKGWREAVQECARVADDHALIKGAHIHKGLRYCVLEVAEQIKNLKMPGGK